MVLSTVNSDPKIRAEVETEIVEDGKTFRGYQIDLSFDNGTQSALLVGSAFEKTRQFRVRPMAPNSVTRKTMSEISFSIDGVMRTDMETGIETDP